MKWLLAVGLAVVIAGICLSLSGNLDGPQDVPVADEGARSSATAPMAVRTQWQRFVEEQFAFDQACAECHAEQFAAHQRSGHSHTATPMAASLLAKQLDGTTYTDPRRRQTFEFSRNEQNFFVREQDEPMPKFPVQWLLGSGTHAQTPVSVDAATGQGIEFRWTWFASTRQLNVTPDHERFDDFRQRSLECLGRPMKPEQALACLACHMTSVPPPGMAPTPDSFLPNVGCERCHGPRKKHVELAHVGRAEEAPPLIQYDDPEAYLHQCGQCHRDGTNVQGETRPGELARFQPYGLQRSKCFQADPKSLTCSACHNPHDHVSHDVEQYVAVCQQCHGAAGQSHCSAQPQGNCIECHMPAVEWHSGIQFHDHWIRISRHDSD